MASLLLLIKTRRLSRRERDTVLHSDKSTRNCANQRLILRDVLKSRRLRDGNSTCYTTATRRLRDEIRDVLRRDNFVAKTNVNLIDKNH